MNEIELKKLWTALQGKFDIGTFESFKTNMNTPEKRKRFYNVLSTKFEIMPYPDFEKRLSGDTNILFPPCVGQYGKPTMGPKNQLSVTIGENPGTRVYLFANGRYYDEQSNQMGSYSCNGTTLAMGNLDNTVTGQTTNTGQTVNSTANGVNTPGKIQPKVKFINTDITPEDILQNNKDVSYGMSGNIVGQIQQLLINNGYKNISKSGQPDNRFGSRTYNAVKQFQKDKGIGVDGVVGQMTWNKLNGQPTSSGLNLASLAPQDNEPNGVRNGD